MILHQCPVVHIVAEIKPFICILYLCLWELDITDFIWNKGDKAEALRHNLEEPA